MLFDSLDSKSAQSRSHPWW